MPTVWANNYAERTKRAGSSVISEILKLTAEPDVISFGGGVPAPELFPTARIKEATNFVLDEQGVQALQYSIAEGYPPLRQMVADEMQAQGIPFTIDNVVITSGSQQALDLMGKIWINPGDRIIVEEPSYLGMIQAWNPYEPEYVTVPTDDEGIIPEELEKALKSGPARLIYLIPNFQNPMGVTIPAERREKIARLADSYGVPIVEDDPYGYLRFEGEEIPHLMSFDAKNFSLPMSEYPEKGNVVRLGTFSKTLCPGFRVAWAVGPTDLIREMVQAKTGADLHTSTYTQMVAYETAKEGFIDEHILLLREKYRQRRDVMLNAMQKMFPEGIEWTHPKGGLFLWVRLPKHVDATEVLKTAIKDYRVAYVPGEPFHANGGGKNTLRMSFSTATARQIEEGIDRLSRVFRSEI